MINDISVLQNDLPRIYDINNFLITPEKLHPHNPRYIKQWNEYKKRSIEGQWVYDQYGWRFMPATLFSYGNLFKFETRQGKQTVTKKPDVRDIDWIIHYSFLEASGFSGFKNDDSYTSDRAIFDNKVIEYLKYSKEESDQKRYLALYKENGKFKEYAEPRPFLKELTNRDNLGKPLYNNPAQNMMIFGSRGGGKSYSVAGIVSQMMLCDGLKEYTKSSLDQKPKAVIDIGASSDKFSSELISKVIFNLNLHGTDPDFGAWSTPTNHDFIPGPFYVDWVGSYSANNSKNPYRYEYEVETPAGWQTMGTGTRLYHTNYSEKKASGAQSGSGGRRNLVAYEEIGLQPNFVTTLLNNDAVVTDDKGDQFGVQIGIGTSGNIELVQQSKKVFNDPKTYKFLAYPNLWEESDSEIGLFLPAYLTNSRFKDKNGNTNVEEALKFYLERRKEAAKKDDPEVLRNEKMNFPLVPSDMWVSSKGSYFPTIELLEKEKELVLGQKYKQLSTPVLLSWDSSGATKVIPDESAEPFYFFPYDKTMSNHNGCVMIYEEPTPTIELDQYIYVLDPYVSENIDEGGSIGCFQVWLNPKYLHKTNYKSLLVATYYGKNPDGKDAFYEVIEKLINKYGNCPRMLWYEANRGDSVRGYFIRKNKTHILCIRPTREKGSAAKERNVTEYGFMVGNQIDKKDMITDASEILTTKFRFNGVDVMLVYTINDLFLIQQLIQYDLKGNFDAVSAFLGFPLALKELKHYEKIEDEKRLHNNPLAFLSVNPNLFYAKR